MLPALTTGQLCCIMELLRSSLDTETPCAPRPRRRYTYKGSRSGFWTGDLAQRFRAEAYRRHGIIMPPAAPRTITLLNNAHSEKVVSRLATYHCQPPPRHPACSCMLGT